MYAYEPILSSIERRVRALYARQVMDESRPEQGAFISEILGCPAATHGAHAHDLACACYVFMAEGASLEGDDELFDRIRRGISFQKRWQRPGGLIDGVVSNYESPNATAFTVQLLAPVVEVARGKAEAGDERAAQIAQALGEYVQTAAQAIIGRGFHTPNHRWVICSALAQAITLFPDLSAWDYIESILAETVDINEDGQFYERSTGIYNSASDRSLRFIADHLGRPELLDPVRKNLDMMLRLFHPDWTVVTDMSGRQDRGQRIVPVKIADSFFDMAQRDGNGVWATVADCLVDNASGDLDFVWLIHPFMANSACRHDTLKREMPPDDFSTVFLASRLWRVKRGLLSATAMGGNFTSFAVRYGEVNLKTVKIFETYYNTSKFETDTFEAFENGVRMVHRGDTRRQRNYDLPLGRPVPFDDFYAVQAEREHWALSPFDILLDIREVQRGFDLHLQTEGALDRIAFQIECCFEGPGEWETDGQVIRVNNGQTAILKSGYGIFHRGEYGIRIGPGSVAHRMWQMRGSEPEPDSFRVLVTLQTPIDCAFEIRYGTWSTATSGLLEPT